MKVEKLNELVTEVAIYAGMPREEVLALPAVVFAVLLERARSRRSS